MATSCSLDNTLTVEIQTINDKVMYTATSRDNPKLTIDYFPPFGEGNGYTSLELLMIAFGSCVSTVVLTLLRYKMKKTVSGVSAQVNGTVREQHPKALEHIVLFLKFRAKDLTDAEVQAALKIAEDTMCPVWSMLKGNVTVEVKTEITESYEC